MKRLFAWAFFCLLIPGIAWGQDVQYSQYYANPIYLNPALVGSTGLTRLGVNFRNQWPALDQTFVAYTAYVDHYEERWNSGFGLILQGANESFTETSWNEVGIAYSYRLQLSTNSFIQAGMQGSFIARDAYFGRVVLGSQLDLDRGSIDYSGSGFAGGKSGTGCRCACRFDVLWEASLVGSFYGSPSTTQYQLCSGWHEPITEKTKFARGVSI